MTVQSDMVGVQLVFLYFCSAVWLVVPEVVISSLDSAVWIFAVL